MGFLLLLFHVCVCVCVCVHACVRVRFLFFSSSEGGVGGVSTKDFVLTHEHNRDVQNSVMEKRCINR